MNDTSGVDNLHPADHQAIEQLLSVRPEWIGQKPASELTGAPDNVLLHAGPQFSEPSGITAPILNSACVAAVYEGLANDFNGARAAILAGDVVLKPAQDFGAVTPLASVVSMSMPLHVVRDATNHDCVAFAPVNGGNGPAMRLGICNQATLDHLRWLNDEFATQLPVSAARPIDLIDIARDGIGEGDDCHGRTMAATKLLATRIESGLDQRSKAFLDDGPSFFLNLWMAAVKCMMHGADGVPGSSLVTAAGANGLETGIKLSGLPGRWWVAKADPPNGGLDVEVAATRKLGAIGDSAVVDAMGFGAMCMNLAPAQQAGLGQYMPPDWSGLAEQILAVVHPAFGELSLRVGTLARTIADTNVLPVVSLGVLDNEGELGRLGGGIFTQPRVLFEQGIAALGDDGE